MSTFEVRGRDGLARLGLLRLEETEIQTPAAVEMQKLFPSLENRAFTNLPLSAPASDAERYYVPGSNPVLFHPQAACPAVSGDVVMLSPASASFDHFRNFMERGEEFKKTVRDL